MKKSALVTSIIGLAIQCFGVGFMLYGVNNNMSLFWVGTGIFFLGLMIIAIGLIMTGLKGLKKEKNAPQQGV